MKDARITPDVYLDILYLMKWEEKKKREELKKAQYEGIVKALEKKKEERELWKTACKPAGGFSGTGGILSEKPYPAGDLPQKDLTEKGHLYKYVKVLQSEHEHTF